jgi:hypothetical protein
MKTNWYPIFSGTFLKMTKTAEENVLYQYLNKFKIFYIQYSETNVMNFLFNLLRIKSPYMFRALPAHLQKALHKQQLVYCVRVRSVGFYQDWSSWSSTPNLVANNWHNTHARTQTYIYTDTVSRYTHCALCLIMDVSETPMWETEIWTRIRLHWIGNIEICVGYLHSTHMHLLQIYFVCHIHVW